CGPCKMIKPHVEKFANDYENMIILCYDVDVATNEAASDKVTSMPTFIMKDSNLNELERFSGASSEKLKDLINKHHT
ncbi:MAG: hypothetical protein MHPSP_003265, partial [Paramarteilia canceri]